jgi:hypothetical protein
MSNSQIRITEYKISVDIPIIHHDPTIVVCKSLPILSNGSKKVQNIFTVLLKNKFRLQVGLEPSWRQLFILNLSSCCLCLPVVWMRGFLFLIYSWVLIFKCLEKWVGVRSSLPSRSICLFIWEFGVFLTKEIGLFQIREIVKKRGLTEGTLTAKVFFSRKEERRKTG